MLRKIRITLAVLFFSAVTALFLDFTGTVHTYLGWTAKVQFLPALMAVNVVRARICVLPDRSVPSMWRDIRGIVHINPYAC